MTGGEPSRVIFLPSVGSAETATPLGRSERAVRLGCRTIEEIVPEMHEEVFEDWPMEGPRTIASSLRYLRRQSVRWIA